MTIDITKLSCSQEFQRLLPGPGVKSIITLWHNASLDTAIEAIKEEHLYFVDQILGWWDSLGIHMPLQGFGAARLKDDPFGWHKAMMPVVAVDVRDPLWERHQGGIR
jgi:hypothetical protein